MNEYTTYIWMNYALSTWKLVCIFPRTRSKAQHVEKRLMILPGNASVFSRKKALLSGRYLYTILRSQNHLNVHILQSYVINRYSYLWYTGYSAAYFCGDWIHFLTRYKFVWRLSSLYCTSWQPNIHLSQFSSEKRLHVWSSQLPACSRICTFVPVMQRR